MADVINITPLQPVALGTGGIYLGPNSVTKQALYDAVEASSFDILDLEAVILSVSTSTGSPKLEIWTGMQTQTEDGWIPCITMTSVPAVQTYLVNQTAGFLRYLRWVYTAGGGASESITFYIRGMGRRY